MSQKSEIKNDIPKHKEAEKYNYLKEFQEFI